MIDELEALRTFPLASLKYLPVQRERDSWVALAVPGPAERDEKGLPIPPDPLLVGYADSAPVYLESGALHVRTMNEKLRESGFELGSARRILDFGCGIGRMIRHLPDYNKTAQIWGVDISATHIEWCKEQLRPPFHFATTTTIPHLPFPDGYFDLVYAGSVFTHIDDLPDAWILEMRRVLSPNGRAYITLSDDNTIHLCETHWSYSRHWLADQLRNSPEYQQNKHTFGMLVIGRGLGCQVFYQPDYFAKMIRTSFTIAGRHPEEHGFQTVYVLVPVA
jgi:SAM-dependent methyltransferase